MFVSEYQSLGEWFHQTLSQGLLTPFASCQPGIVREPKEILHPGTPNLILMPTLLRSLMEFTVP